MRDTPDSDVRDTDRELQEMVAESDSGARHPPGLPGRILFGTALVWSLFQLWVASPLPFMAGVGVFNDTEVRAIHLAFALFLAYTAYPAFASSPRQHIPIADWVMAIAAAASAAYIFLFYTELSARSGAPTPVDLAVGICGMVLLPLALSDPFWQALAYTLIFGMISSTTLIIISFPYYYLLFERIRDWKNKKIPSLR